MKYKHKYLAKPVLDDDITDEWYICKVVDAVNEMGEVLGAMTDDGAVKDEAQFIEYCCKEAENYLYRDDERKCWFWEGFEVSLYYCPFCGREFPV